jgi:hypothetical protein
MAKRFIPVFLKAPLTASLLLFSSCEKEKAGLGGDVILTLYPEHHAKPIYGQPNYLDSAMLKFNSSEFPGDDPGLYDAIFTGNAGEHFVRVAGLKKGQYFIYMAGWDTAISQRVVGGIPYKITASSGELTAAVPVTEGD